MAEEEQHSNGTHRFILEAPFSLIKYESEIEITDNIEQYEKAKDNQKVLDQKPSPEGTSYSHSRCAQQYDFAEGLENY